MAMLKPLGIDKGKPFQPDARQRAVLEEAARIGDAMGRTMLFNGHERISGANAFAGTNWNWIMLVNPTQETDTYSQLDERLHYHYGAIYTSPGMGVKKSPGSQYIQAFKDKDGNRLDGGKSYRLHVPADAPAAAFWSVTPTAPPENLVAGSTVFTTTPQPVPLNNYPKFSVKCCNLMEADRAIK